MLSKLSIAVLQFAIQLAISKNISETLSTTPSDEETLSSEQHQVSQKMAFPTEKSSYVAPYSIPLQSTIPSSLYNVASGEYIDFKVQCWVENSVIRYCIRTGAILINQ